MQNMVRFVQILRHNDGIYSLRIHIYSKCTKVRVEMMRPSYGEGVSGQRFWLGLWLFVNPFLLILLER